MTLTILLSAWCGPVHAGENAESSRADATAARIEREWPLQRLGPIPRYIDTLGARLSSSAHPSPYPWRFTVIRDRSVNAFAIGGGRIYVTDGALRACDDEAELAALLAHEMAHELAGHFGDGSGRHAPGISEYFAALFSTGTERSRAIRLGSIVQQVDPAREREADQLSIRILIAADYDPHAALRLRERLNVPGTSTRSSEALERVEALRASLADTPRKGQTDSAEFQLVRHRMLGE